VRGFCNSTAVQTVTRIQATYFNPNVLYSYLVPILLYSRVSVKRASMMGGNRARQPRSMSAEKSITALPISADTSPPRRPFSGLFAFSKLIWDHCNTYRIQSRYQTKGYSVDTNRFESTTNCPIMKHWTLINPSPKRILTEAQSTKLSKMG